MCRWRDRRSARRTLSPSLRTAGCTRMVTLALAVPLLMLLASAEARAHAFLVNTDPQPGARLEVSPRSLRLQFSERPAGAERVRVRRFEGREVGIGPIQALQNEPALEASLPSLPDGVYLVSWQALSEDGHLSVGEFAFAVGRAGRLSAGAQNPGRIGWPDAAAAWLSVGGLLLASGALASERWVWSGVARRYGTRVPRLPAGWFLAGSLFGTLFGLVLLARRTGAGPQALPGSIPWGAGLAARAGWLAAGQGALVAYGLWLLPMRRLRSLALVPLTLALGMAAFQGHPGTAPAWWAGPANALHLGAVALWIGGLLHLALVAARLHSEGDRRALLEGAGRYAALALGIVALALASGTVVALSQFAAPRELAGTTYGRILLIKLVLVASALALALVARRRALLASAGPPMGLLRRLVRREGALLLAAVTAAVVLASAAPPRSLALGDLVGPPPLEGPVVRLGGMAGFLAVHLAAAPDRLQVRVLEPGGAPAADARIRIRGFRPNGSGLEVSPRLCGPGCATVALRWEEGTTALAVTTSSGRWGPGAVRFQVPWPPQPEDADLFERVVATMRAQPRVALTERVSPTGSRKNSFDLTGEQFVALQPYAAGGATDIRPLPSTPETRRLTFYLPGSSFWILWEIDGNDRLGRETILAPGHLIERSFDYHGGGP